MPKAQQPLASQYLPALSQEDREALQKIATGIPSLYEVSLLDDQQLVAAIVRHRRDSLLQYLAFCVARQIRHQATKKD